MSKNISLTALKKLKDSREKIVSLTAYDASFAALMDAAGVEVVLVGDSLGMVIQGQETTVPVTIDDMVYHSRAVSRGVKRAFLIADMPFMSYATVESAISNAARLMQEGGAKMVKLEAGALQAELVYAMTSRGIPVCGHIGLQPQFVHKLGGYKVQGREEDAAEAMIADGLALIDAGVDMLLVECVPAPLGARLQKEMSVPVIGIGAGPDVDGQILVLYDILNVSLGKIPSFSKSFIDSGHSIQGALSSYVKAVKSIEFPSLEHCF